MTSSLLVGLLSVGGFLNLFVDTVDAHAADGLFGVGALVFGVLSFGLSFSLVVVTQVASLAHSDGVVQLLSVLAVPGHLISAELSVARRAHVLGVVLSIDMWALGDLHDIGLDLWLCLVSTTDILWNLNVDFLSDLLSDLN